MKSRSSFIAAIFIFFVFIVFSFSGGYLLGQSPMAPVQVFAAPVENQADFEPFWEVWDLVHERYLRQPVDDTVLVEGAIEGMLATLDDPHTRYLSPEDQAAAAEAMSGEFQGIGAEVEDVDGNITVVAPIDGSPAEAAGIQSGDILREADGVALTGMDVAEAAALVRGPAGTAVQLVIERDGELLNIEIIRDVIKLVSVRGEILEDDIAYLRLSRFGETTDEELADVLSELVAQDPAGLILDLRSNPGGALDTTVEVADQFLDEGTVLVQSYGSGEERLYESTDEGLAEEIPMVVLVDEGSASASEVLAGAIQDRERAVVIGQTSFGKGTVQTWHTLSNNGGVRITIAEWLTPEKTSIDQRVPEAENEDEFEDTQLQAAIDFLNGETIIDVPPEPES